MCCINRCCTSQAIAHSLPVSITNVSVIFDPLYESRLTKREIDMALGLNFLKISSFGMSRIRRVLRLRL